MRWSFEKWNWPSESARATDRGNGVRALPCERDALPFIGRDPPEGSFARLLRTQQLKRARFVWRSEFAPGGSSPSLALMAVQR